MFSYIHFLLFSVFKSGSGWIYSGNHYFACRVSGWIGMCVRVSMSVRLSVFLCLCQCINGTMFVVIVCLTAFKIVSVYCCALVSSLSAVWRLGWSDLKLFSYCDFCFRDFGFVVHHRNILSSLIWVEFLSCVFTFVLYIIVLVCFFLCAFVFGGYLLWSLSPSLSVEPDWRDWLKRWQLSKWFVQSPEPCSNPRLTTDGKMHFKLLYLLGGRRIAPVAGVPVKP